ncbi:hypothetical protein CRM22_003451 [Opisthorchis felineus]|uniref:Uncharacterized protein n=1 Tax=Opisthorchis felineus TaxID=147828 RepID=A0A4S2M155_OPIFE|nr:hypothetical protein CRM22_003451 [Opisthorchis felineus]
MIKPATCSIVFFCCFFNFSLFRLTFWTVMAIALRTWTAFFTISPDPFTVAPAPLGLSDCKVITCTLSICLHSLFRLSGDIPTALEKISVYYRILESVSFRITRQHFL